MIAKVPSDMPGRVHVPDTSDPAAFSSGPSAGASSASAAAPGGAPLLTILWRRRWVLLLTTVASLALAAAYLVVATPIYTASSGVYIEQNGTKILTDGTGLMTKSDSFLYTQAEIMKSAPILSAALERVDYHQMKTFEKVDNPVAWLQVGKALSVEVGKKDDVVTVSLDSPYPQEAADVVNSIVDAYMTAQGARKKSTAAEMLKVLQKEKENRYAELTGKIAEMRKFKEENGALSFQADKSNIILDRLAKLSDALTGLELQSVAMKSEYEAAKAMLQDPVRIRAYVEDLQTRNSNGGDKQYEEARSELLKYQTMQYTLGRTYGEKSQVVQTVKANVEGLNAALEAKERTIAEQRVTQLEQDMGVAQANEQAVRSAYDAQRKEAKELNSKEAEYARLEDERNNLVKQCSELDNRVKEVTVNSADAAPMNIQVVEVARPENKPSKPRKALTMAAALLAGLVAGTALSLLWDWLDQRIRTPEEASDSLGVALLGVVPQMGGKNPRGQCVHLEPRSAVAEAYRTVRTAVHFGAGESVRTLLVTSPAPGDGKSTTASNLAITLAQAGHRTLLLDADLRKPTQHKIFDLSDSDGLSSVILGQKKLREVIRHSPVVRLDVLPCGPCPSNPSEIIAGSRFAQVIRALIEGYDRVVIDSPPVMAVTDARILAASADATVLVLRTNRSTRKGSRLALDALLSSGANVLGTVVNAMPQQAGVYARYGVYGVYGAYGYGAAYASDNAAAESAQSADPSLGQLPQDALLLPGADEPEEPVAAGELSLS